MLSCGKVIGQLTKISRHGQTVCLHRPPQCAGFISFNSLLYSDDAKDKKPYRPPGTTVKVEECLPGSTYQNSKATPTPPKISRPVCEVRPDGLCPPSCYEECNPGGQGGIPPCREPLLGEEQRKQLRYWAKVLAAVFVAGATAFTLSRLKLSDDKVVKEAPKKEEKDKTWRGRQTVKVPDNSQDIPKNIPYLLVGGGTAAFSAFRSIKTRDPKAKVLVITEEGDLPYMRPPLSKELWYNTDRSITAQLNFKQWNGTQRSLFYEPPEFYANVPDIAESEKGGVAVARGWKVKKIDVEKKVAVLENGYEIHYEKCLLATGATPKNLPIFETAEDDVKKRVIPFRTTDDFLELENNIHDPHVKNIVIIGGGFLGSELACSLARNYRENKRVYQVYKEKFIMAQVLPEYLSEWTTKRVVAEGVQCIPNSEVEDLELKNGKLTLFLTSQNAIQADQVIVAVGAEANTQLAGPSDLEVDPDVGGFLVNAELEARSDLWIAGDAACFYDVRLGRRRVEHHDHAVISGRLAGENMTGARKPYIHQSMFWSDLGPEVGYEAIGIVDSSLPTVGVFAKATDVDTPLAAVSASDESLRSKSEEDVASGKSQPKLKAELMTQEIPEAFQEKCDTDKDPEKEMKVKDFGKGVVFYLKNDIVVGIVLWNIFNRMSIARQVLARGAQYDDLNDVAKLFTIHDD
ncbi:apoptosis-inducing factor 1, mitochondrial [Orussus abietinus]|uniref:apoptosis-inducing factor 1, mitochondrial n=1 Tax=Orussus abietinus TaxID=222816 RepID=UPI000626DAC8|nr:apoptosis-inducing factor 1, mitochondrial [Orussus abietinus]